MSTAPNRTPAEEAYISSFEDAQSGWLASKRREGHAAFGELGLPHRRIEAWKFTDLRRLVDGAYPPLTDASLVDVDQVQQLAKQSIFSGIERATAVFVDGRFRRELSKLPEDEALEVFSIADSPDSAPSWISDNLGQIVPQADDAVSALNIAYMIDGAAIRVSGQANAPLELIFIQTGAEARTITTRNLVILDDNAASEIYESHIAPAGTRYFNNIVTEVKLGDGARLDHVKVQAESAEAIHLSNLHALLGGDAKLNSFTATVGARVSRQQGFIEYAGENTEAQVSGAYLLAGKQHGDTTLVVDHAVPNCTSRELFKIVLDDYARGVFQGKVCVRPHAQKTDGKQMAQALLLAPDAEFDSKPELEIFADDVVCGHGATAGELDEDLLFYLRARGIPKDEAMGLLVAAFVGEAFEEVESEPVREALGEMAASWLTSHKKGA
ncbi:MAG: Fe-S cluster assembly protein SufD [Pseudomonadota bacterium]